MRRLYRHLIQISLLLFGTALLIWSFWGNQENADTPPTMEELFAFVGGIAALIVGGYFLFMDVAFQLLIQPNKHPRDPEKYSP